MNCTIIKEARFFRIEFPFHPVLVRAIREIPGRKFINGKDGKYWFIPIENIQAVESFAAKFRITIQEASSLSRIQEEERAIPEPPPLPELPFNIDEFIFSKSKQSFAFPFQKSGIAFAIESRRLLIGDKPGLGKTVQTIATVESLARIHGEEEVFPALIVCPSSLKLNWQDEVHDWTKGRKALILDDRTKNNFIHYYESGLVQYFITNYQSLKKFFVESIDKPKRAKGFKLKDINFKAVTAKIKTVVIDESHRVKEPTSQQSKFLKGIATGKKNIIALSGTPTVNKPKDLAAQLSIIGRIEEFGGAKYFLERYCSGPKEASRLNELNFKLKSLCYYGRSKEEVLKDLPAKTRQIVKVEIETRHEYNEAKADLVRYLREYKKATEPEIIRSMRGEVMVRIGILKNISARGKIRAVCELVRDLLDTGEKLILFAHLKDVISGLKESFPDALTITGEDDEHQRNEAKKRFQEDESAKLIICSIKAAGVGITLTASSRVSFIELPWHFADCEQCEDRAHRIGQKDNVTVTYFLGRDTIDEWIYSKIIEKKEIGQAIQGIEDNTEESFVEGIVDLFNQENKIKL